MVETLRPAPGDPREALRMATAGRLDALNAGFLQPKIQALADAMPIPGAVDKKAGEVFGKQRLETLKGIVAANRNVIEGDAGLRKTLLIPHSEAAQKRLETIMDALVAEPPALGDKPEDNKRYIVMSSFTGDGPDKEKEFIYRLRVENLREDQNIIRQMMQNGAFAPQMGQLQQLLECLQRYEQMDPLTVQGYEMRNQKRGALGQGVAHMGKLAFFVAAMAMALVTGVSSVVSGKLPTASIFYLGLGLLIGKPHLIKGLFGPKEQRELEEAGSVLRDPAFAPLCAQNGIMGEDWAKAATAMMEEPKTTDAVMKKVKAGKRDSDEVKDFLKSMPHFVQHKLWEMMGKDRQFTAFAQLLLRARGEQPQQLVAEYIRKGMWSGSNVPDIKLAPGPAVPPAVTV